MGEESLDFREYLGRSVERYWHAYRSIASFDSAQAICDIGGFWGLLPLVLKQLGYDVSMTEALEYYGPAFDGLFGALESVGIRIINHDPFGSKPVDATFDFLTIMAVLEHYPHSLRGFMTNARAMLRRNGGAYVEVPNIAYWPEPGLAGCGYSPLPSVSVIWQSEVPFTGHHHEFTIDEVESLARLSGFTVLEAASFNYSVGRLPMRTLVRHPLTHGLAEVMFRRSPHASRSARLDLETRVTGRRNLGQQGLARWRGRLSVVILALSLPEGSPLGIVQHDGSSLA